MIIYNVENKKGVKMIELWNSFGIDFLPLLLIFVYIIIKILPVSDNKKNKNLKEFKYKFQQNAFDDWIYFTVRAKNQAEADSIAKEKFAMLIDQNKTFSNTFYKAYSFLLFWKRFFI